MFGQAALWCIAAEERGRATLRGELLELVVADRARVSQIEDPNFALLAQSPGALAGLGQQDQVLRHLIPDYRVHDLEIEALADPTVAHNDDLVTALDRRHNRVLAILGIN